MEVTLFIFTLDESLNLVGIIKLGKAGYTSLTFTINIYTCSCINLTQKVVHFPDQWPTILLKPKLFSHVTNLCNVCIVDHGFIITEKCTKIKIISPSEKVWRLMNFSCSLTLVTDSVDKNLLEILKQLYHFHVFSICCDFLFSNRFASIKVFWTLWKELGALRITKKYFPCWYNFGGMCLTRILLPNCWGKIGSMNCFILYGP